LGLVISKRLVEMMHGTMGVESTLGQGSMFWFTARLPKRLALHTPAHKGRHALRGLRVLCVDDNATNRTILEAQLTAWGMQADCVADGPQALARLRAAQRNAQSYGLVILDHQMPDMDGVTLACTIKADPLLAPTPLVMLSSLGQRVHGPEAELADITAYLMKPVRQSHLYNCIATVMGPSATLTPSLSGMPHGAADARMSWQPRILVAEDNVVNQKVARRMLEKLGCRVDVVANGLEAVEAVLRCTYEGIFMDCQMPDMDGYEATAAIRQREAQREVHIPIIAMTAHAMQGDREQCLAAGMDDYVSKPVTADALLAVLRQWVQPARTQGVSVDPPPELRASPPVPLQTLPPALDAEAFAALKELYQDANPRALRELLTQFIQDASTRVDTLRVAATTDDARGLALAAHGLKSSSAGVGALGMATLCQELEQRGRAGISLDALDVIEQLAAEFLRVRQGLEHEGVQVEASLTPAHES
jgi:CheY-like chemotaxis protein/HPt (histidine-containing phosphotransfer) domain-containing protein